MHIFRGELVLLAMLATLAGCATFSSRPLGNRNVPQPAKSVDLDHYLGRWFELYRYEAPFQKDCEAVVADYSMNPDGSIRVLNSCRKGSVDGRAQSNPLRARGQAGGRRRKVRRIRHRHQSAKCLATSPDVPLGAHHVGRVNSRIARRADLCRQMADHRAHRPTIGRYRSYPWP